MPGAAALIVALFNMIMVCFLQVKPAACSELVRPFYTRNMNPFVQIYGLPATEGAGLIAEHRLEARFVFDIANNFTDSVEQGEGLVIRGETYRSVLAMRYGIGKKLEIGIDLPYVYHGAENLNDFIREWHNTFGLPQGGRDKAVDDGLAYLYADGGNNSQVAVAGSTSGIGDVLLAAAIPLWESGEENPRRLTLRASLKLPTGSASDLQGSGSTDFSLRLCGEDRQSFAAAKISWFGTLGALLLTDGDVLADRQRNAAGFGSVGFGWQPFSRLALQLQLDANTALYDSALTQLGDFSAQLVMGGTIGLPRDFQLDLAISEDVIVNTAPDAVFHLDLRRMF